MKIPKRLSHIWIGPLEPPKEWMNSWIEKHQDWEYTLYDNTFLESFNFKNKHLMEKYYALGMYAGVADLMRYEILYEFGGLLAPADSICYHNTEELFIDECAYTVYENELVRGKLVSPILACEPKNPFVEILINELNSKNIEDIDFAWKTTGNLFVAQMIDKYKPNITIFPSHFFIPIHFEGIIYKGNEKVFSKQLFGSTHGSYKKIPKNNFMKKLYNIKNRQAQKKLIKSFKQKNSIKCRELFQLDFHK